MSRQEEIFEATHERIMTASRKPQKPPTDYTERYLKFDGARGMVDFEDLKGCYRVATDYDDNGVLKIKNPITITSSGIQSASKPIYSPVMYYFYTCDAILELMSFCDQGKQIKNITDVTWIRRQNKNKRLCEIQYKNSYITHISLAMPTITLIELEYEQVEVKMIPVDNRTGTTKFQNKGSSS